MYPESWTHIKCGALLFYDIVLVTFGYESICACGWQKCRIVNVCDIFPQLQDRNSGTASGCRCIVGWDTRTR